MILRNQSVKLIIINSIEFAKPKRDRRIRFWKRINADKIQCRPVSIHLKEFNEEVMFDFCKQGAEPVDR